MFQRCAKIQVVAAYVAAAWIVLFGVALAEGLGLYQDTPDNLDQGMEQVLSSDGITDAQALDFARVTHPSVTVVASLPASHTLCVNPHLSIGIGEHTARTTKGLALYRLHSTYLI